MASPVYKGVIFDYFGTLTAAAPRSERRAAAHRIAEALGLPGDTFFGQLTATFTERATGRHGNLAETMTWVAGLCGCAPSAEQLSAACAIRREMEATFARMYRPDAVEVLRELVARGLSVGVISDCTHELAESWQDLPFAEFVGTVVFSVELGERKPHPSLYWTAVKGLGVAPAEALYVGDGDSNELTGATAVGMTALQLVADDTAGALHYDPEIAWGGPTVHSLHEVLSFLGEP